MINFILVILIFCIVLFLYIHIYFHLKTSNDLEIYEIQHPSKDKLEEICDLKQPVIFHYNNENIKSIFTRDNIKNKYGVFDIKIRNISNDINEVLYIPMKYNDGILALEKNKQYIIENNYDFLEETSLIKDLKSNDSFIRPYIISSSEYDYIIASTSYRTPLKYNINYRNYYYVVEGNVKIKLTPPKNSKYLYEIKDYDNFEFTSLINPWEVQEEYKNDFDKVKCLEVILNKSQIIYIPPYWWYSFEFGENSTMCQFKYSTYMNNIAVLPHYIIKFLQSQNVKRYIVNKIIK